ncbi:MAG: alkyl hydroperoxide reductase subunit F [Oceanospirillaceae bacterium]|nr:alkyl hydroperoxide reductase subunit F [Oceanospirillaceae bacterium]MCP5335360.1 alkyl hydroperoxide reductase subunit F [Oceanospirillaceae bacterium]
MLDTSLKQQLKTYLQNLKRPVQLVVSLGNDAKSAEVDALAQEIAELHPAVNYRRDDNASSRKPNMQILGENGSVMNFAGVPLGHEFTSLVLALLHTGGHPIKITPEQVEQIKSLQGNYEFETYISLSCQNCPDVVQALNIISALNTNFRHTMIDGALFQAEVSDRKIMAVPSVYMNGELFGQGRMTLTDILKKLDKGAEARQAAALNEKSPYEMLIVGGGPAGSAAAIYAARKGIRTGVVADRFGGQVMDTLAIENFISVKHTEGPKLVAGLEAHVREYGVDIMDGQKVKTLLGADKSASGLVEITTESGATLKTRALLLATGARWREMNVPGEKEYRNKGVAYCPHCDGPLFKGKDVAVIGGGNSGIEAAIDLAGIVKSVTVLEFADTLRADAVLVKKAESMGNITIIKNAQTTEVIGDGEKVVALHYKDRISGEAKEVKLAGIFVQIGLVPNTEFLKESGVTLTNRGEIEVGARGETSLAGVFAAGDVTDIPYKQIIIAMGEGAKASLGAFDYLIRTPAPVQNEVAA